MNLIIYNNLYSFSNPCFLINLINNHPNGICIKKVYHDNTNLIIEEIDITNIKQNDENDEYIINIISNDLYIFHRLDIYTPIIYNEKNKIKNAKKINLFNKNEFIPEKDYFIYEHLKNERQILHIGFYFETYGYIEFIVALTKESDIIKKYYLKPGTIYGDSIEIVIEKEGIYFLHFIPINYSIKKYHFVYFACYLFNTMIENIDLSKNNYFGFLPNYNNSSNSINDLAYYKISKLSEDKNVYFIFEKNLEDYQEEYKYISPFIICENEYDECINVNYSYYFLKGKKYTIYINLILNYPYYNHKYFYAYSFFPVTQNTIQTINSEGTYIIDSPKIFFIEEKLKLYFVLYNIKAYNVTSKCVTQLSSLYKYKLSEGSNCVTRFYIEKDYQYRTIILIPEGNNKLKQIFISRKELKPSEQIVLEKNENGIILINDINERGNIFKLLDNYFMIFNSPKKNLRFIILIK